MITSFSGKYLFLSNFYEAPVTYDGMTFKNNEAAYQAQKAYRAMDKALFLKMTPRTAKAWGRRIEIRKGWDDLKVNIMYDICKAKFTQNLDLKQRLLDTEREYLQEGNNWGDTFWGSCQGVGENNLGLILMQVRKELQIYELLDYSYCGKCDEIRGILDDYFKKGEEK